LPRKTDSNNPADWIFFAESDLEGIRLLVNSEVSNLLCQSKLAETLEKILKAELVLLGWRLVKTHDLQQLAQELHARGSDLSPDCKAHCDSLAERYFSDRYPGFDIEDADWPALRKQTEEIAALLQRVKSRLPSS
jgi:HEPN domain-containing protein